MKIVVIGGSGLIGSKLVDLLRQRGHEVVAASPNTGVNTLTGEGLAAALAGAQVVVDVANSPTLDDKAAMDFFATSGRNLLAAEKTAGVKHHVALSIVGTQRLVESGYMRAKAAQEDLIKASSIPYSILQSTQFFEFVERIAKGALDGDVYRLSPALMQPIAADDTVARLADIALGAPLNATVEVGGPEAVPLDELARRVLAVHKDSHKVMADTHARYFGAELNDQSLIPGPKAHLSSLTFDAWLKQTAADTGQKTASPQKSGRLKLYYAPGACSLSDHIALIEAGLNFEIEAVDIPTKRTASGVDFHQINPKAYVPALVLENGDIVTENVAVLDWIAAQAVALQPKITLSRTRVLEMLSFISSEIHHAFKPMWHGGDEAEKEKARDTIAGLLQLAASQMRGSYLFGDTLSVADCYLFVILRWAEKFGVTVPKTLLHLQWRMEARPAVQAAIAQEGSFLRDRSAATASRNVQRRTASPSDHADQPHP